MELFPIGRWSRERECVPESKIAAYLGVGAASCSSYAKMSHPFWFVSSSKLWEKSAASKQPSECLSQGDVSSGSAHFIAISKR